VINAYVVFRSMEGRERMIQAYNYNRASRFCLARCCKSTHITDKYFFGRWLEVTPGPEPSDILWENLGTSRRERAARITITFLLSLIFVIAASFMAAKLETV